MEHQATAMSDASVPCAIRRLPKLLTCLPKSGHGLSVYLELDLRDQFRFRSLKNSNYQIQRGSTIASTVIKVTNILTRISYRLNSDIQSKNIAVLQQSNAQVYYL